MGFSTHWWCLACGHHEPESSGWPCWKCHGGPLIRLVVTEPEVVR